MARANLAAIRCICFVLMLSCLTPLVGCVSMIANLMNVAGRGMVPAAYNGLREKKVAVVCVSNSELFGPTSTSTELAVRLNRLLRKNVKDIEMVPQQSVADWIDRNNWDMVDFRAVGVGVGAELVVAVDVDSVRLYDGKTMYKGRSVVHVVVYDTATGAEVFAKSPPEIVFPTTAGVFVADMSERDFRKHFLDVLADRIVRNFYPYDINEDYVRDAAVLSNI